MPTSLTSIVHADSKNDKADTNALPSRELAVIWVSFFIEQMSPTDFGVAPEMLSGNGYSWEIDYWGLGNIVYEMFFYRLPFGFKAKSDEDLLRSICEDELLFPPNANEICSPECIDLIKGVRRMD
jgi:serine/threonine protein kinase